MGLFYAADLICAGIGAFMIFLALNAMDAPTAIFLVGAVAAFSGVFFSIRMLKKSVLDFFNYDLAEVNSSKSHKLLDF